MLPEGFDMISPGPDRLAEVLELDRWAFPTTDALEDLLAVPSPLTWERTRAVIRSGRPEELVALRASYPFGHCPVPGRSRSAARRGSVRFTWREARP